MSRYSLPQSPVPLWRPVEADPSRFYPEDLVTRSKAYQRPLQRAALASSVVAAVLAIVFITAHVGPGIARTLDAPWMLELIAVLGAFLLTDMVLGAPITVWRFKHENRWGFNKQSPAGKVLDELKEFAFSFVLLAILSVAIFGLVRSTATWWLVAMVVVAAFNLALSFLSPTLIRLFYKMTPMQDQELRERLLALAARAGVDVGEIYVMDMSKRTTRDNAFFTGLGKTKRIVVGDNMLQLGHDAVEVVVAHEIGHWRRHGLVKRVVTTTLLAPLFFGAVALIVRAEPVQDWAGISSEGEPGALPLFFLGAGVLNTATRWISRWRSRWREREADLDALELTGNLDAYRTLWMQMPERNLPDLDPSVWARLRATHPQTAERLAFADVWESARARKVASS